MRHIRGSEKGSRHDPYRVAPKEWMTWGCLYVLGAAGISLLFYDSLWGMLALLPVSLLLLRDTAREIRAKKKEKAAREFRDFLEHISAGLYAGVSLENAYIRAVSALKELYMEGMITEAVLEEGVSMLKMNIPMDRIFIRMAQVLCLEDVKSFALLVAASRQSGGNLIQMISQTAFHISEKIKTDQEIITLVAAKRLEQRMMCIMPFAMVMYMRLTSPGYFDVLYHNAFGILFMSICLLVILIAYLLGKYIVDIHV